MKLTAKEVAALEEKRRLRAYEAYRLSQYVLRVTNNSLVELLANEVGPYHPKAAESLRKALSLINEAAGELIDPEKRRSDSAKYFKQ